MSEWQPIETAPEGEVVMTAIIDGEQRNTTDLVRKGRLWFYPDMSMYVYYTPTHWRRSEGNRLGDSGPPKM